MIKLLGIFELILGAALIIASNYFMLESSFFPERDRHGYLLMMTIFGSGAGGLLAFSGVVCLNCKKYKLISHIPILMYLIVAWIVFDIIYSA